MGYDTAPAQFFRTSRMYDAVAVLLKAFFAICRLQRGPQDLPSSGLLLGLTLAAYTGSSIALNLIGLPPGPSLIVALVDTGLMVGFTLAALELWGCARRSMQTLTALAGTGMVLSLIAFPVILWLARARSNRESIYIPDTLELLLVIWGILVMAHIFRHALSSTFLIGFVLAVGYFWLLLNAVYTVLPSLVRP